MYRVRSKTHNIENNVRVATSKSVNFERQAMIQYDHVLVIWKSYYRIKNWSAVAT